MDFFRDMATNPFLGTGLLAGLFASVSCGLVGPYVITRRLVFLAGAIAHVAVGGIGAAVFAAHRYPEALGWISPVHGAALAAILAAVALAVVHDRAGERLDTLVGALWATGMAVGILLVKLTPGYHTELMSYLFGNLAYVSHGDVALLGGVAILATVITLTFHKRFVAICLDPEQAALQGIPVLSTHIVLLVLVALAVIALTQVVGLILVIALVSLPAATAGRLVPRFSSMIWITLVLSAGLTTIPRIAVYGTAVSPESAIVLSAAGLYLIVATATRRRAGPEAVR